MAAKLHMQEPGAFVLLEASASGWQDMMNQNTQSGTEPGAVQGIQPEALRRALLKQPLPWTTVVAYGSLQCMMLAGPSKFNGGSPSRAPFLPCASHSQVLDCVPAICPLQFCKELPRFRVAMREITGFGSSNYARQDRGVVHFFGRDGLL